MKSITIHPASALIGVAFTLLIIALVSAAQTPGVVQPIPREHVDVYYPPIPISSLEFFPVHYCATQSTTADVVTVRPGERLALLCSPGANPVVLPWPLIDTDGNGAYDVIRGVSYSPFGMPSVFLAPGQYVFASDFSPSCTPQSGPPRDPEGLFGYRFRSQ